MKEVLVGDGERRRRYVVCHNPQEAERQRRHRAAVLDALCAELATLAPPPRGARHSKRTGALRTSDRYGRSLRQTRAGALRISRAAVAAEAKLDGKWVITTSDDTLTPEDLALGDTQLLRVEQCWRTMQSGLRTRLVSRWRTHRICAHVSLCVLALLLERVAERRAGDTWRNLLAQLDTVKVVAYERAGTRIQQTTELRGPLPALLERLRVPPPPALHAIRPAPAPAGAWQHGLGRRPGPNCASCRKECVPLGRGQHRKSGRSTS